MDIYRLQRGFVRLRRRFRPGRIAAWLWPFFGIEDARWRNASFIGFTSAYLALAFFLDNRLSVIPLAAALVGVLGTIWRWLRVEGERSQLSEPDPSAPTKKPDYRFDFFLAALALFCIVPLALYVSLSFGAQFTTDGHQPSLIALSVYGLDRLLAAVDVFDVRDAYALNFDWIYTAFGVERIAPHSSLAQFMAVALSIFYNALLITGVVVLVRSFWVTEKAYQALVHSPQMAIRLGSSRMRHKLAKALNGVDERRILHAATAIREMEDRKHFHALARAAGAAPSPDARTICLETLVALHRSQAHPLLRRVAKERTFAHTQIAAFRLLSDYDAEDEDYEIALTALASRSPIVRQAAVRYLTTRQEKLPEAVNAKLLEERDAEPFETVQAEYARLKLVEETAAQ